MSIASLLFYFNNLTKMYLLCMPLNKKQFCRDGISYVFCQTCRFNLVSSRIFDFLFRFFKQAAAERIEEIFVALVDTTSVPKKRIQWQKKLEIQTFYQKNLLSFFSFLFEKRTQIIDVYWKCYLPMAERHTMAVFPKLYSFRASWNLF